MNEIELAWAAGLFDGEGSVYVDPRMKSLQVNIGQKTRTVLERFRDAVEAGTVYPTRRDTEEFFYYNLTNARDQVTALAAIWPYLSEPKRAQTRAALEQLRLVRGHLTRRVAKVEAAYAELEGVIRGS